MFLVETADLPTSFDVKYSGAQLVMHLKTRTAKRGYWIFKCGYCGKGFSRAWVLKGHVRMHTGEKPYQCSTCGGAFADRSNLRQHLQTFAFANICILQLRTMAVEIAHVHSLGSCT